MGKRILKTVTSTLLAMSMVVNGMSMSALAAEPDISTNSSANSFVFEDDADSDDSSQSINYKFKEKSDAETTVDDETNSSVATPSDATINDGVNLMSTHTPINDINDLEAVIEDEKTENPVFTITHKEELESNPDVRIEFYQYMPEDINADVSDILNDDIAKLKDKTGAIDSDSESGMEYFELVKSIQGDTGIPFEYELSLVDDAYSFMMFRVVNTNDGTTYQAKSRADGYLKEIKTDMFQIPIDRFEAKAEVVMYEGEPYMVLDSFTLDGEPLPEDKFTLDIYSSFDYLAHRDAFNKNGNDLNFDGYKTPYQAFIKDETYTIPGDYVSSYNNGNAFKIKNDSTSIFDWTSNAVYGIRLDIDLHSAQRSNSGYQQAINTRTEKIHSTPALFDTRRILGEVVVDDKDNLARESVHDVSIYLDNETDGEAGAGNRFFDGNVVEVEEYNFNDDDIEVRLSVSTDKDKDNFVNLDWEKTNQVTFPDKYNGETVYKVAVAARVKRQLVHEQMEDIVSLVDGKEYNEPIDIYYIVGAKGSDYLECGYDFDGGKVKKGDYPSIFTLEEPPVQLESVDIDKDYPENSTDLAKHPHPGDTITATVEPADATVKWQWKYYTVKPANTISLNHEELIDIPGANSNTYTVTENDVGKILVAVATGTGKYTGTAMFDFYSSDSGAEIGCVTEYVKLESISIGTKTVSDPTGKEDIVLYPIVTTVPDVGLYGDCSWFIDGEPFAANYDNDGDGINESLLVTNEINNKVVTLKVNAYAETEGIPSSTGYYGHEYTGSYGLDFLQKPTVVGKINADVKVELGDSLYGDSGFYIGDTLEATTDITDVYDEAENIKIEWIVCDDEKGTNPKTVKSSNGDNSSFTLTDEYKNKYIKVKVSYDGTGKEHFNNLPFESELTPVRIHSLDSVSLKYKKASESDYTDKIDKLLPGDSLKADDVKIENGKTANSDDYKYQWYSCDKDGSNAKEIAGATNQTFTVTDDLVGKYIEVVVTGQNNINGTISVISGPVSSEQEPEPEQKPTEPETEPETKPAEPETKPESGINGGYSGSSDSDSGSSTSSIKNGAVNGTWTYNEATDKWTLNNHQFKNQWVYVYNPYATVAQGQYDWFYFDANGEMVTGWFTDANGLVYYLNETSDGTRGAMRTGWVWIGGKCYYFHEKSDGTKGHLLKGTTTPDGYTVDATGAWTVDGTVITN